MPTSRCLVLAVLAPGAIAWAALTTSAQAFDDSDFCAAVRQLAVAVDGDVGVWIDRVTRNGGMVISCEKKKVEFRRFTYASTKSMTYTWKQEKHAEWN